jgi:hypothetical protein
MATGRWWKLQRGLGNEITVVVVVFHAAAAAIVGWAARHLVVRHHVRPIDLRGQCGMRPIDTFYHRSEFNGFDAYSCLYIALCLRSIAITS